ASPIPAAILAGDEVTGISTMYLSEGLDEGDVILQARLPIGPDDTAATVAQRLIELGVPLLLETLALLEAGRAPRIPQDPARAPAAERAGGPAAAGDAGVAGSGPGAPDAPGPGPANLRAPAQEGGRRRGLAPRCRLPGPPRPGLSPLARGLHPVPGPPGPHSE